VTLDELRSIVSALSAEEVEYVLIGAAALNAHGIVRATEDVDIMVRATVENVARLRRALRSIWDDTAIEEITAEDLAGDYPAIRYGPPSGTVYLDIIARFGEALDFAGVEFQEIDLGGVRARVATPEALYRMKNNTVRPIDRADADLLKQRFRIEDD
jgi:hypothetical protein